MKNRNRQTGLSLVEIMVALAISALLLAGVAQLFINNKQVYRTLENLSHVQESGRFAMEFMTRDIRNADFWGCMKNAAFEDCLTSTPGFESGRICNHLDPAYSEYADDWDSGGIGGTDNNNSAVTSDGETDADNDSIIDGTDTLILRGAFDSGIFVYSTPTTTAAEAKLSPDSGLAVGDIILISNCQVGDLFAITSFNDSNSTFDNITGNTGANDVFARNASKVLQEKYGRDAAVYKYAELIYFLGTGANGEPALFRSENGVNSEFVSGVENMQIEYGIDIGNVGNIDYYVAGAAAGVWDNVVSIRITLTVRSPENRVSADNSDRLRKTYVSTIGVRNRLN